MYVSKIDNQPSFGLTYINKKSWNKDILRTLEKSKLVKEIDKKYPVAYASYTKIREENAFNDEPNFHLSFILKLAKDKIWNFNIDSHSSEGTNKALIAELKSKRLEDVEKEAKPTIETLRERIDIKYDKSNPITRFFKKLFN